MENEDIKLVKKRIKNIEDKVFATWEQNKISTNLKEIVDLKKEFSKKLLLLGQKTRPYEEGSSIPSLINQIENIFDKISEKAITITKKLNIIKRQLKD